MEKNEPIRWGKYFNKILYNLTSRGFLGFLFFGTIFLMVVISFLDMTEEAAETKKFIFDACNYTALTSFIAFVGRTGYYKWLERKSSSQ